LINKFKHLFAVVRFIVSLTKADDRGILDSYWLIDSSKKAPILYYKLKNAGKYFFFT